MLFAVAIGFTTLVPYPSALTIALVSALLALNDPATGLKVLVAAIRVAKVVDQVIQPCLMDSIRWTAPVWPLTACRGALMGSLTVLGELLGLLLAVHVAS